MLTVNIPTDQGIFLRLPLMAGNIRKRVSMAVYRLAIELQRYIVVNKLSGQVLNKRTGRLARSIQQRVVDTPTDIRAYVFSAGDVKYAAIHEYGGVIPAHKVQAKNAQALSFMWHGKRVTVKSVQIPNVHMPERSFMRSSLRENALKIQEKIREAAILGVKES